MKMAMEKARSLPVCIQWQIHAEFSVAYLGLLGRKKSHILPFPEVLFLVSARV